MVLRRKIEAKFRIQWQKWSFWAQISPFLSSGDTVSDRNNLYLDILRSEETYLAINTFVNEYREFMKEIFRQFWLILTPFGPFLTPNEVKNVGKMIKSWRKYARYNANI